MTDWEKLDMLKTLIGPTKLPDDTLFSYLNIAASKVLRRCYPFMSDTQEHSVPIRYEMEQVELARNIVLKRGSDGQSSMTDNGVSRVYESDDVILRRIIPYAHVPGVVADEAT